MPTMKWPAVTNRAVLWAAVVLPLPLISVYDLPLPLLRFHTVVAQNDWLWSFGGEIANNTPFVSRYSFDVHKINVATRKTATEQKLPRPVAHAATAALHGYAVTVGGMSVDGSGNFTSSKDVLLTQLATGKSFIHTLLPVGVHDPEVVKVDENKAISYGGWAGLYSAKQAALITVSPDGRSVSVEPFSLSESRVYATGHLLPDGRVLAIGGLYRSATERRLLSSIEVIDPIAKTSTLFGHLKVARRNYMSQLVGNAVYVLGGTSTNVMGRPPAEGTVERIDLVTRRSSIVGRLSQPRYLAHSFVLTHGSKKYIMLVGGQIRDGVPATSIEIFNIKAGQSETVTSRPLVTLDHDRVSVCVGSKAYVLGGEDVLLNAGTRKLIEIAFPADVTCSRQ